jgi:hypothetical protein
LKHRIFGRAMRGRRIALPFALVLGLSGCLVSQAPLIAPGEAAFPLPDGARAEHLTCGSEEPCETQGESTTRRSGAGYVLRNEGQDEEVEFLLKAISRNAFIAQTKTEEGGYLYGLLVVDGRTVNKYDVECQDFSSDDQQRYGLSPKDGDDCTVTSIEGLTSAYLAFLKRSPKPSEAYILR